MNASEQNNPVSPSWVAARADNNPIPYESPDPNPRGWDRSRNPEGKAPTLNPEHYINPLSGRYTSGPLDF